MKSVLRSGSPITSTKPRCEFRLARLSRKSLALIKKMHAPTGCSRMMRTGPPSFPRKTLMDSTSISLLRRLRQPNQEAAWQRFVDLYAPLIFHWSKNQGLTPTDASDLVQDVLAIVVEKLPEFEYDPQRRFRGWLRTVTVN
jgi:hypothetical protein